MEGLTTRDGTTFPALGLRAEATTATACSHMYKNVVEAVKLELQTIQASGESPELDVDRIELSLWAMHVSHACHMHEPAGIWNCDVWSAARVDAAHIYHFGASVVVHLFRGASVYSTLCQSSKLIYAWTLTC